MNYWQVIGLHLLIFASCFVLAFFADLLVSLLKVMKARYCRPAGRKFKNTAKRTIGACLDVQLDVRVTVDELLGRTAPLEDFSRYLFQESSASGTQMTS